MGPNTFKRRGEDKGSVSTHKVAGVMSRDGFLSRWNGKNKVLSCSTSDETSLSAACSGTDTQQEVDPYGISMHKEKNGPSV